ncbi:DUF3055 domain-containing protein [Paenibacillus sp. ACRRX]|uniref:DUF3055 domain-containing protein n=1 Tax=unclassified Paenibacillus TaxID=185978 RepID=UPI001EF48DEF|nr:MULTISPECIES: DUF3055 domain-containing protein [unclassified Paenibacillus]MCG7409831.1 DUF3055 domain-containing protein [Paenibacillus sp. ACRRX]MDK8183101.1 DUF3055 domain-containing protein [Paenibacillus sp. UMB4589-SE434]
MNHELDFLSDYTEDTTSRFVTFIGESLHRFDLAVTTTSRFYGKKLVTDLQSGITGIIGQDDLKDEGYLEAHFKLGIEEAEELRQFLYLVVGEAHFTD